MSTDYSHVLSPIRVAGQLIRNRIITGPVTLHSDSYGELYPSEREMRFFEDRAKAGAGIVTCAGVATGPAGNDGMHAAWNLYDLHCCNAIAELAERIHLHGAKASMELIGIFPGEQAVSDGASHMSGMPGREITIAEMESFKANYVYCAKVLKELGYDAILLHMGHSIPVAQFLSPLTNKRTDQYGGSLENRCRYPMEIIHAVREAVGSNMIIEIRFSGSEFKEGGIDLDEGIRIAELLQEYADILQVSAGMHSPELMTVTHPCGFLPPMPNVFLAEGVKKSGKVHKLINAIGGIGSLEDADDIIASGKSDFVTIARALIADDELIIKGKEGRQEDVIPCVKCLRCHDTAVYGRHFQCTVNPRVGIEHLLDRFTSKAEKSKKVAVIGGGPAGMKAALTAVERGHAVTLYEASEALGGALRFSDYVSFKYPLKAYKDYLVLQIQKSTVEVKLNTVATPDEIRSEGYDAVITAVGGEPIVPKIPGIENAILATDVYGNEAQSGKNIVIIGGGHIGCETALHLAKMGKHVTIIEAQDTLAPDASTSQRDELMAEIEKEKAVTVCTNAKCIGITINSVAYESKSEQRSLEADTVILAAGMKSMTDAADGFLNAAQEVIQIGDCVKVRTVEWATKEAFYAAIKL